jgi:hypothetical protein
VTSIDTTIFSSSGYLGTTEGRPSNSPSPTANAENTWNFIAKPLNPLGDTNYFKAYASTYSTAISVFKIQLCLLSIRNYFVFQSSLNNTMYRNLLFYNKDV